MAFEFLETLQEGDIFSPNPNVKHPFYEDMRDEWEKCRDCYAGEKQVKFQGTKYLPRLGDQTDDQYNNYRMRAQFYGATNRTVEAYLGMIFRKPVTFTANYNGEATDEFNKFVQRYLDTLTVDSKNINEFAHQITEELIVTNRIGILIDMPNVDDDLSIADYEKYGIHPRLSVYRAETIFNWFVVKENGRSMPIMYVLYEPYQTYEKASFESKTLPGYRILYLENYQDMTNRRYKNIRVRAENTLGYEAGPLRVDSITYPLNNGEYIKEIPFYVLSDQGVDYDRVRLPMISDLANVNLGHYRNSADLENELHFVSLKTIAYPGWDVKVNGNPRVGGAISTPRDQVPVLLEPSSDSSIREEMTLKEARLAVLGAERISQKQRYLPSASVAEITASAEASVIQNFLTSLNLSINRIIRAAIEWTKPLWPEYSEGEIEINVQVNTDLAENSLTGADLVNFVAAYQQGGISLDTLYYNLERREIYPTGWSKEKEWMSLLKTKDLILSEAMTNIVEGGTNNPFFREEEESDNGQRSDSTAGETRSSGTGADVTVRDIGTSARVRSS